MAPGREGVARSPPVETRVLAPAPGNGVRYSSARPDSLDTKARRRPSGDKDASHSSNGDWRIGEGVRSPDSGRAEDVDVAAHGSLLEHHGPSVG